MKVILTETIEPLGIIGTEVNVKDGYARNYLLPKQKAVPATDANRRRLENEKKKLELQLAKEKATAEAMAEQLKDISVTILARVSEENRLYGSVTVKDIQEALEKKGVEVQKRMILLPETIKELGTYTVPIRVYRDVEPEITVEVTPA